MQTAWLSWTMAEGEMTMIAVTGAVGFIGTNLARLLAGCYGNDMTLIREGLADVLIEPRRAQFIPGFANVKQAALDHCALGGSISGAGPSVFAWFEHEAPAREAGKAMAEAFGAAGLASDVIVSPVDAPGARLVGIWAERLAGPVLVEARVGIRREVLAVERQRLCRGKAAGGRLRAARAGCSNTPLLPP
jgi:hypothetical protein